MSGGPNERAARLTIFATTCPLLKFAIKVRNEARRLAKEAGAEEYQRKTYLDFPRAYYDALRRLIQEFR